MLARAPLSFNATLASAPSGAASVPDTIERMRALIKAGRTSADVLARARALVRTCPEGDELCEIRAVYRFVRDQIRFVRDVLETETLSTASLTLRAMQGDCDDQTILLCSMLEAIGYPTKLVVADYTGNGFEHVYCLVFARGLWIPCDATQRDFDIGREPFGAVRAHAERE